MAIAGLREDFTQNFAAMLLGFGAMVEMTYRLQVDSAMGPQMTYLGQAIDASSFGSWAMAIGAAGAANAGLMAAAILTEAAEQCARTALPRLAAPVKLDALLRGWEHALGAPDEIIRYLVECYTTMHPEYILDWGGMIRVLAEGRAPPSRVPACATAPRSKPACCCRSTGPRTRTRTGPYECPHAHFVCSGGPALHSRTVRQALRVTD